MILAGFPFPSLNYDARNIEQMVEPRDEEAGPKVAAISEMG